MLELRLKQPLHASDDAIRLVRVAAERGYNVRLSDADLRFSVEYEFGRCIFDDDTDDEFWEFCKKWFDL